MTTAFVGVVCVLALAGAAASTAVSPAPASSNRVFFFMVFSREGRAGEYLLRGWGVNRPRGSWSRFNRVLLLLRRERVLDVVRDRLDRQVPDVGGVVHRLDRVVDGERHRVVHRLDVHRVTRV